MKTIISFFAGLIFSIGLVISDMTNPAKIRNFLDIGGMWDPSLIFVMLGGAAVAYVGFRFVTHRERPIFAEKFYLPAANQIDAKLIGGSVLFGIGWGLSGLCPGPAIAGLAWGRWEMFAFIAAALVGMSAADRLRAGAEHRAPAAAE